MYSDFSHSITFSYQSYDTDWIFFPFGGDDGIIGGSSSFFTTGSGGGGGSGGALAHLHKNRIMM